MGTRQAFDGCLQSPPTPEPPVPPAVCYKRTAGLGPASITEPFDAQSRVIYFVPLVRLLAPFAHQAGLFAR